MRLWSLHPRYLDGKGLVACWREALLAQSVLLGRTRGYHHHPQLERFQAQKDPVAYIGMYLWHLAEEAEKRGYRFRRDRIVRIKRGLKLPVTRGQLTFEWQHLQAKLRLRDRDWLKSLSGVHEPEPHPLFFVTEGPLARWERPR